MSDLSVNIQKFQLVKEMLNQGYEPTDISNKTGISIDEIKLYLSIINDGVAITDFKECEEENKKIK